MVTLVLGGLGVMNVMLVAVRERTREIGVRKALGARASEILRQFFFEALLIVFLSGGIGLGIAYGICAMVNLLPCRISLRATADLENRVAGLLVAGMIAVLSALYRRGRAASIDPIEALRYEAGG